MVRSWWSPTWCPSWRRRTPGSTGLGSASTWCRSAWPWASSSPGHGRLAEANDEVAEARRASASCSTRPHRHRQARVDGRFLEVNRPTATSRLRPATSWDDRADVHHRTTGRQPGFIAKLLTGELDQFKYEKRYVHAADTWCGWRSTVPPCATPGEPLFLIARSDITSGASSATSWPHAVTDRSPACQPCPVHGAPRDRLRHTRSSGRQWPHVPRPRRFKLVNDGIATTPGPLLDGGSAAPWRTAQRRRAGRFAATSSPCSARCRADDVRPWWPPP